MQRANYHKHLLTRPALLASPTVNILLTNDDGIFAPGLAALEKELRTLGDVTVVAPATEQSGVGHSITFLRPLICTEAYDDEDRFRGYAVEGSPADCVKMGVSEFIPGRPDLVVSGINGGLNAGINVLYSGTVAAAIEGAFFGIMSIAVSLEFAEHPHFDRAAVLARKLIVQLLEKAGDQPQLFNVNIPTAATEQDGDPEVRVCPMGVARYGEQFMKRIDPRGRAYYWATNEPAPEPTDEETDLTALADGCLTVTPLQYDMTKRDVFDSMQHWGLRIC